MNDIQNPTTTQTSSLTKLVNIYSDPSSVFEEVRLQEKTTMNWLLPVLGAILVGIIFTFVVFSDPVIQQEMRNTQMKQLQERVQKGEMTQEQFDRSMEFIPEPGSTIFLVTGILGIIVYSFAAVLLVSLVMMFAGKMLWNTSLLYAKMMEVVGLSYGIFILSTLITMFTIILSGSISKTYSAAFFLDNFSADNFAHHLLQSLDVFSLWYVFVLSVGMGKLYQKQTSSAAVVVLGVWVLYVLAAAAIGVSF